MNEPERGEWLKEQEERRQHILKNVVEEALGHIRQSIEDQWPNIDDKPYLAISKNPFGFYCSVMEDDEYAVYVPWSEFCRICASEDDAEEMRLHAKAFRQLASDLDDRAEWFEGGCQGDPPFFEQGESYDVD